MTRTKYINVLSPFAWRLHLKFSPVASDEDVERQLTSDRLPRSSNDLDDVERQLTSDLLPGSSNDLDLDL